MHASLIVLDDFYTDPMEIRRMALNLDYPRPDTPRPYPGRNSRQRLLIEGLDELISGITSETLVASTTYAHGHCRISLAADDPRRQYFVHIDPDVYWSGILYLSLPEHCQGGTEFFRHRELGTDRAPIHPDEIAAAGANSYTEAGDRIVQRDSNDATKWERIMTVPMRFNRLILLRPWLWHTAGPSFGDADENGRLVQLFFFTQGEPERPAR